MCSFQRLANSLGDWCFLSFLHPTVLRFDYHQKTFDSRWKKQTKVSWNEFTKRYNFYLCLLDRKLRFFNLKGTGGSCFPPFPVWSLADNFWSRGVFSIEILWLFPLLNVELQQNKKFKIYILGHVTWPYLVSGHWQMLKFEKMPIIFDTVAQIQWCHQPWRQLWWQDRHSHSFSCSNWQVSFCNRSILIFTHQPYLDRGLKNSLRPPPS